MRCFAWTNYILATSTTTKPPISHSSHHRWQRDKLQFQFSRELFCKGPNNIERYAKPRPRSSSVAVTTVVSLFVRAANDRDAQILPKTEIEHRRSNTHPTRKLLVSMRMRHRGGICVQRNITAFSLSAAGKLCKLPMIGDRALARAHTQAQTQMDSRYSMETAMCKLDAKQIDRFGEIRSKMCAQKTCFAARRMLNNGTNGNYRQPRQDWKRFTSSGLSIDAATIVLSTKTNFCVDTHLIESQPIVLKVSGFLE